MAKTILNLNKCIIISKARNIRDGKKEIPSIRKLAEALEQIDFDKYDRDKIKFILYRANTVGCKMIDKELKQHIMKILSVTEDELVLISIK